MTPHTKRKLIHYWHRQVRPILVLVLVFTAFRSTFADWNDVPTGSMKPTIIEGDRVFVNKLAFDLKVPFTTWRLATWGEPKRGDIVVFFSPYDGIRLVKRVIGLPGDQIEMRNNILFVNGTAVNYRPLRAEITANFAGEEKGSHTFAEEALGPNAHAMMLTPQLSSLRSFGPIVVPQKNYFMMGDNRDNSFDSRYWGTVSRDKIVGRVPLVVISMDREHHYLPRWKRFFSTLQ